jgi:hypothetical protein
MFALAESYGNFPFLDQSLIIVSVGLSDGLVPRGSEGGAAGGNDGANYCLPSGISPKRIWRVVAPECPNLIIIAELDPGGGRA